MNLPFKLPLSPVLTGMTPYRVAHHPAPVELRLAGNEGPAIPAALRGFEDLSGEVVRCYPQPVELQSEIAQSLGLQPDQVLLTAGADDALARAIRLVAAPGREILVPTPTFEMIERYARLMGAGVVSVPWWRGELPVREILAALREGTTAVVLVTPNNPTGAAASTADIESLLAGLGDRLLIVDQAYGEFADEDPTPILVQRSNVILIRTLSKAFGLAGLRIGVAAGPVQLVDWLRTVGHPYPVAGPSLVLARRVITDEGAWRVDYLTRVRHERDRLVELLTEMGQRPSASQANFVLCEFDDAEWVADGLAGLGVAVRRFSGRTRLERCLRITCPGSQDGWQRLEESLRTVLAPQALLFDMDGVLADVRLSYRRAIRETAARFGVRLSERQIDAAKAAGDANNDWQVTWRLVRAQRPEVDFDEIQEVFESLYQGGAQGGGLWRCESLMIHRDRLESLAQRLPLAVVTGRPRGDAERFLQQFGIAGLFSTMVTMEDGPAKPDPLPVRLALRGLGVERAWMLGDTPDDMLAARAAGAVGIGYLRADSSREKRERLLSCGAARVLSDFKDLVELLEPSATKGER